ncbi:MAG TPA: hemerythrin domain-containing protein [Actinomycetes bacterium]|nr:hemerythrin domain-containing protein [Actinomycetes bacterium]
MSDQTIAAPPSGAASTTTLHPGVAVQYAVHAAVRRDMDRLVGSLGTHAAPDAAVLGYAEEFLFQLHHHHTFEDDAVWPLMRERLGDMTDLLDRNLAEHADVVASVEDFAAEVQHLDGDRDPARAAAVRMREVVSLHLAHEEADVIPFVPQAFTLDDVARFQALSAEENPPSRFLPWVLESAPPPIAAGFAAVLPAPVQQALTDTWMPAWQAKVDALG